MQTLNDLNHNYQEEALIVRDISRNLTGLENCLGHLQNTTEDARKAFGELFKAIPDKLPLEDIQKQVELRIQDLEALRVEIAASRVKVQRASGADA